MLPGLMLRIMYLPPVFDCSAKVLVRGEPNVSYICSRYYRAPELIFGATDYTCQIGEYYASCNCYLRICQVDVRCTSLVSKIVMGYEYYVCCNCYLRNCQEDVRCTSLVSKIVMGCVG